MPEASRDRRKLARRRAERRRVLRDGDGVEVDHAEDVVVAVLVGRPSGGSPQCNCRASSEPEGLMPEKTRSRFLLWVGAAVRASDVGAAMSRCLSFVAARCRRILDTREKQNAPRPPGTRGFRAFVVPPTFEPTHDRVHHERVGSFASTGMRFRTLRCSASLTGGSRLALRYCAVRAAACRAIPRRSSAGFHHPGSLRLGATRVLVLVEASSF